jgi:deoxycytidylate deaminase
MHKYLEKAMDLCLSHDYDESLNFHHCAMIVRGGNILSVGFNSSKTSGFVEYYADLARGYGRSYCLSTHAEMAAILKVRKKTDLTNCTMYVVRRSFLESKDLYAMSRPCTICSLILPRFGIKKCYYSMDNNTYGMMCACHNIEDNTDKIIHC